jgi:hypothetical protein
MSVAGEEITWTLRKYQVSWLSCLRAHCVATTSYAATKRKSIYTSLSSKYLRGESNRNPARGLGDVMMTGAACKATQAYQLTYSFF